MPKENTSSNPANEILQRRLKYLESLLENQSNYFVLRFSLDGKYTYINPALCRRLGIEEVDLLGTSAFEGILEEDAIAAGQAMQECMENVGKPSFVRIRRYMPDGSLGVGDYELVAIADEDGTVTEIQSMGVEVTGALKQLKELNEYKSRLESILSSISDGFFVLDKDWRFTYVNNIMAASLGQTPDSLVGQSMWAFMPLDLVAIFREKFLEAIEGQKSVHFEPYIASTGSWISVVSYPTPDGLSVFSRDITAFKKTQEQVRRRDLTLKEIVWMQSHKVRGPLARILGLVQIFNVAEPEDPENRVVLGLLKTASLDLDLVIREVVAKAYEEDVQAERAR